MEARFSVSVQTSPGAHPASCTIGTGSFPGAKSGRGVTLTPHPLPVSLSRKSRVISLLPLWAAWPVQSLSACTRVHFTFLPLLEGRKIFFTGTRTRSRGVLIPQGPRALVYYIATSTDQLKGDLCKTQLQAPWTAASILN